jgi:uncharacterized protein YegL
MNLLDSFTTGTPRPLPVILMLDTSGSMRVDGKIEALNLGLVDMVETLRAEDDGTGAIHVAIVTFGGDEAEIVRPLEPVAQMSIEPLDAAGRTPMGGAFELVSAMVDDRDVIPSRAYRPTIALLSDGIPTDDWEGPLAAFLAGDRTQKATRLALGIGADASRECLREFAGENHHVRRIDEASQIRDYLQFVSMSVVARSASQDPNAEVTVDAPDIPVWEDVQF